MERSVIIERKANHFRGPGYADGGKLLLSPESLIFTPHKLNLPGGEFEIKLHQIVRIYKKDVVGFSKQIWIDLENGDTEKFVVWERDEFIEEVKKQISKDNGN